MKNPYRLTTNNGVITIEDRLSGSMLTNFKTKEEAIKMMDFVMGCESPPKVIEILSKHGVH